MIRRQDGFTVVELLIATVVFTMVLLVITSGVTHFTHAYYKGVHQSSTQTTSRNVINTIAQNIQYGGGKKDFTQRSPTDDDNNE
jgi:prepilin-type N-terminal cleavage/methylation domain-containing protein